MKEASKAAIRRRKDGNRWDEIFVGFGLDIGPGDDPCNSVVPWKISTLEKFDFDRGDANFIRQHFSDESFDFIHSSHSLEHMKRHPWYCCQDWACLLEVGGHLVITVPDYEMYEKMTWPSRSNSDHSWAFYTEEIEGSPWVLKMADIVAPLQDAGMEVLHIRRLTEGWDPSDSADQTLSLEAGIECAWEVLAVKRTHVPLRTPVSIRRQQALGDTIAVSAFYNHMALKHDITLQTSPAYVEYHHGVSAISELTQYVDIDLDGYDQLNPYVPLYLLGFHKARIPVPENVAPKLQLTAEETTEVTVAKAEKYAVIDISTVALMSRSVWFDVLEVAEHLSERGIDIRYLEACAPRDFIKLIAAASVVISRDSGATQLAQALNTPYVSLMSSVRAEARYVERSNAQTLSSRCPIGEDGCYHRFWLSRDCPVPVDGVAPCGIIPTAVILDAIDKVLITAPPSS